MAGPVLLLCCFILGVANVAAHKAVAMSGHPMVHAMRRGNRWLFGGPVGYALDVALLAAAMYYAALGHMVAALLYIGYSIVNALSAWLLLSRRV